MVLYYFLQASAVLFFVFVLSTVTISMWQKAKKREEESYHFEPVMYKDVLDRRD